MERIQTFAHMPAETARKHFELGKDAKDWTIESAQNDLKKYDLSTDKIQSYSYRPFDNRFTFYTGNPKVFHCRPRGNLMKNMMGSENLALCFIRRSREGVLLVVEGLLGFEPADKEGQSEEGEPEGGEGVAAAVALLKFGEQVVGEGARGGSAQIGDGGVGHGDGGFQQAEVVLENLEESGLVGGGEPRGGGGGPFAGQSVDGREAQAQVVVSGEGEADALMGFEGEGFEAGLLFADAFDKAVRGEDDGGEPFGIAAAVGVEGEDKLPGVAAFPQHDQRVFAHPDEGLISREEGEPGHGASEKAVPVEVPHQGVVLGKYLAELAFVFARVDEKAALAGGRAVFADAFPVEIGGFPGDEVGEEVEDALSPLFPGGDPHPEGFWFGLEKGKDIIQTVGVGVEAQDAALTACGEGSAQGGEGFGGEGDALRGGGAAFGDFDAEFPLRGGVAEVDDGGGPFEASVGERLHAHAGESGIVQGASHAEDLGTGGGGVGGMGGDPEEESVGADAFAGAVEGRGGVMLKQRGAPGVQGGEGFGQGFAAIERGHGGIAGGDEPFASRGGPGEAAEFGAEGGEGFFAEGGHVRGVVEDDGNGLDGFGAGPPGLCQEEGEEEDAEELHP
ncbi:MAG: hypothetical protein JJU05_07720 [Verrucomicrobia bacterium]|nr:hypothetical protein [Verrucomicrobiota bacterium]